MAVINADATWSGLWNAQTTYQLGDTVDRESGGEWPVSSANANRGVYLECTSADGASKSGKTSPFADTMTPGQEVVDGDLTWTVRQKKHAGDVFEEIKRKSGAVYQKPLSTSINISSSERRKTTEYLPKLAKAGGIERVGAKEKTLKILERFDSQGGDVSIDARLEDGPTPDRVSVGLAWDNGINKLRNQNLIDSKKGLCSVPGVEMNGETSGNTPGYYLLGDVDLCRTTDCRFKAILLFSGETVKRATVFSVAFVGGKITLRPIAENTQDWVGLPDLSPYQGFSQDDINKMAASF
jgi:hypothetical protein